MTLNVHADLVDGHLDDMGDSGDVSCPKALSDSERTQSPAVSAIRA
ncbi:MAG TPA: hypothetical protein PK428_09780 [Phycicoccus sp.]|nr:hypothetical protein [Phycicoccus sp.]